MSLEAGEAHTRWATTGNLQLTAHLASFESLTNLGNGDLTLCAGHVETEWGSATNLQLTVHGAAMEGQTNLINADLALWAGRVETKWGSATNAQFNAQWIHALTNAIPLGGEGKLHCRPGEHRVGRREGASARRSPRRATGQRTRPAPTNPGPGGQSSNRIDWIGMAGSAVCSRMGSKSRTSSAAGTGARRS